MIRASPQALPALCTGYHTGTRSKMAPATECTVTWSMKQSPWERFTPALPGSFVSPQQYSPPTHTVLKGVHTDQVWANSKSTCYPGWGEMCCKVGRRHGEFETRNHFYSEHLDQESLTLHLDSDLSKTHTVTDTCHHEPSHQISSTSEPLNFTAKGQLITNMSYIYYRKGINISIVDVAGWD